MAALGSGDDPEVITGEPEVIADHFRFTTSTASIFSVCLHISLSWSYLWLGTIYFIPVFFYQLRGMPGIGFDTKPDPININRFLRYKK